MNYSPFERLRDHVRHPRYHGALDDATVVVEGGNPECGDVVTVYVKIGPDGETIVDAHFTGVGCGVSQAAASLLMERLHQGRWTIGRVAATDFSLVQDLVGPEAARSRPKCASLALSVLKAAIRKYERERRRAALQETSDSATDTAG
ncbi:MAG: iron-sulfur cluster assembly scaffold protein [Thermomicrobium sp.]|nr:iron-sulfur cluster assembly scaffold protein [Thermomicrobium sp.]